MLTYVHVPSASSNLVEFGVHEHTHLDIRTCGARQVICQVALFVQWNWMKTYSPLLTRHDSCVSVSSWTVCLRVLGIAVDSSSLATRVLSTLKG